MRRGFRRRTKKKIAAAIMLVLLFALLFYYVLSIRITPVIKTMALNNARIVTTETINDAVGRVLKEQNVDYDKLMSLDKDANGNVTAVKADTMEINLLKYQVTNEAVKGLNNIDSSKLSVPVGTLVGGQFFSGLGPHVHVTISPVSNVETEIVNNFTSTGINQTRQEVMLNIKATITIIVSSYTFSTTVSSNFDIADTVIVGKVPGSFVVVNDGSGSGTANKIFTYGGTGTQSQSTTGSK